MKGSPQGRLSLLTVVFVDLKSGACPDDSVREGKNELGTLNAQNRLV